MTAVGALPIEIMYIAFIASRLPAKTASQIVIITMGIKANEVGLNAALLRLVPERRFQLTLQCRFIALTEPLFPVSALS